MRCQRQPRLIDASASARSDNKKPLTGYRTGFEEVLPQAFLSKCFGRNSFVYATSGAAWGLGRDGAAVAGAGRGDGHPRCTHLDAVHASPSTEMRFSFISNMRDARCRKRCVSVCDGFIVELCFCCLGPFGSTATKMRSKFSFLGVSVLRRQSKYHQRCVHNKQ